MDEKRYAKVGDLVIHKRSGEMGRVVAVHAPNEYEIAGKPVSCPVVVTDAGTPFLDVPGKTMFDFLPEGIERKIDFLRTMFDDRITDAIRVLCESPSIDERLATAIVGSVIRERMRKEK